MHRSDASTDAAGTSAEPRWPGKFYALAVVTLAVFLVAIICVQPKPKGHGAEAVLAYRPPAGIGSSRVTPKQLEELSGRMQSEGTLRDTLAYLAVSPGRTGEKIAAPTLEELRARLLIQSAASEQGTEALVAVQYVGSSPAQSVAVVEALCEQLVAAHATPLDGPAQAKLAAARQEYRDREQKAEEAREKLAAFLQAHFEQLQHGPKLIAAALQRAQSKVQPIAVTPPAAPKPSPAPAAVPSEPRVQIVTRPAAPTPQIVSPAPNAAPPAVPRVAALPPLDHVDTPLPDLPANAFPATGSPEIAAPRLAPPAVTPPAVAPPAIAPPGAPVAGPPAAPPSVSIPSPPIGPLPTGPRPNPAYAAIKQRIAEVREQQETLAQTHTWAHPVVRNLVDQEMELKRQLRETPEILPASPPPGSQPPANTLPAAAPEKPAPAPTFGTPRRGPTQRDLDAGGWSIPRTSAPPVERAVKPAKDKDDPTEQLLIELFAPESYEKYLALQADYVAWLELSREAWRAEQATLDKVHSAGQKAELSLRAEPHATGRVGGTLGTQQLLFWGALSGLAGCLVGFWAGEGEGSPTIESAEDVTERLGLPVVATLPPATGRAATVSEKEKVVKAAPWVAPAVRIAELTLLAIVCFTVVGVVRSSDLAAQLAADPLTAIAESCAWWKR